MRRYFVWLAFAMIALFAVESGAYLKPFEYAPDKLEAKMIQPEKLLKPLQGKRILIDSGHQGRGNLQKEPIAPGSAVMKTKVSYGTTGVATGVPEYVFTLGLGLKLRKSLADMGAEVLMIREDHHVDISNKERAIIGNELGVDLVIKLHADGAEDETIRGISILYPSMDNEHTEKIAGKSRKAAAYILEGMVRNTRAINRGLKERNDITGFNWSEVPVILIEAGYMSNPQDDLLLNDPIYQELLVKGIVEGSIQYFLHP